MSPDLPRLVDLEADLSILNIREMTPHNGGDTRSVLEQIQTRASGVVSFVDDDHSGLPHYGLDWSHHENRIWVALVRMDGITVDRSWSHEDRMTMPYIPGLLAFREMPSALRLIRGLDLEPGILFVDGGGRLHPRQFGMASHIGVELGWPTLGVAKKLLCGEVSDGAIMLGSDLVGRELSLNGRKPVYVSAGHRMTLTTAVDFCLQQDGGHRLPETIRAADQAARLARKSALGL